MFKYNEVLKLKNKLFFTVSEVAETLGIKRESAWVLCNRYVKNGLFVRLKNNFYVLSQDWDRLGQESLFRLANYLQVPSYISFMTALSYYEVSTQVQRDFVENACLRRSVKFQIQGKELNYYKLKKRLYFDFIKKEDFFIATKEKAFLDALYLYSFGKYKLDFDSLDLKKLDTRRLKKIIKVFPDKTIKIARRICRI